jgi:hypothetical protein
MLAHRAVPCTVPTAKRPCAPPPFVSCTVCPRRLEAAKLEVVEAYKCSDVERRILLLTKAVEVFKGGVVGGDKRLQFFQKVRGDTCFPLPAPPCPLPLAPCPLPLAPCPCPHPHWPLYCVHVLSGMAGQTVEDQIALLRKQVQLSDRHKKVHCSTARLLLLLLLLPLPSWLVKQPL